MLESLAGFSSLNPMVYVIVFAMAFFKSVSERDALTGRDLAQAGYSGIVYCFVAFLLSLFL